ncbi:succinylglutamate desuccinylase/aspartoacylase family protein [Hydrogenophaga sp. XSHU_21]
MHTQYIDLQSPSPGTRQSLSVLRFGAPGRGPKAYIQGALHADEVPAILVARQLAQMLEELEARGAVLGEVVLVPFANPIGLAQHNLGQLQGRFDLRDGRNFNRGYADLAAAAIDRIAPHLTASLEDNTRLIRAALKSAADDLVAVQPADDLKNQLLRLAIDADTVIDLHCDTDAVMHVYALTPQGGLAAQLGAALGAQAVLLATESGDSPFDEACSRPWLDLQQRFAQHPIELACFSATVELRGECDTHHGLARQDALGLCAFLAQRGVLAADIADPLPAPRCEPTPLSGSEPITAPHPGVVVFHRSPGDRVTAGDVIADLVNADTGAVTPLRCQSAGVLYARTSQRWASAGKRLAKIAGTTLARSGRLLSP